MALDNHDKARALLDRSVVEGISPDDQRWLDAHVEQCVDCAEYADLSTRAVRALDWFALEPDPAAARRVELVVTRRADEMRSAEARARTLWIGTAVALFLTFIGSAIAWRGFAALADRWNLSDPEWQIAFAAFWLLPSLLLALLPLVRSRFLGADSDIDFQEHTV